MNSKIKRREITALIDNIKEHSDRLTDFDSIPQLELNVIISKINRLHETTVILKYLLTRENNTDGSELVDELPVISELEEEDVEEVVTEETIPIVKLTPDVETEEDNNQENNSDVLEVVDDQEIDSSLEELNETNSTELEEDEEIIVEMEVDEADVEEESTELEEGEEIVVEMEFESEEEEISVNVDELLKTIKADELDNAPDVNEQYAGEEDNSISEQLQKQPISDLVSAIGLNERYLYANELFDGDLDIFKESLNHLNDLANIELAAQYFWSELGVKYNWDKENELVKALFNLVERRFI